MNFRPTQEFSYIFQVAVLCTPTLRDSSDDPGPRIGHR